MAATAARFRVHGRLDRAGKEIDGTLTIDRGTGIVSVRPLRSRRTYEITLDALADLIVQRVITHEYATKRAASPRKGKWRKEGP